MTSAAELLYTRRSRYDRNDHESDSPPEMNHHHGFNHRHHHRRSQHHRHGSVRESVRVFEDAVRSGSGNVVDIESLINGSRLGGDERLPEDVLLAKERLVQRLRGVSLSEHKSPRASPDSWDKSASEYTNINIC